MERKKRNGKRGWTPERRFLAKIEIDSNGCWLWTGSLLNSGYGQFWANGKKTTAHRFAYEFYHGPVPDGMDVCHKCDVKRCANPDHLFAETTNGNLADMIQKGRSATGARNGMRKHPDLVKRGEQHHGAKATEKAVRLTRNLHADNVPIAQIAKTVGLGQTTVRHILNGDTWKHIQ